MSRARGGVFGLLVVATFAAFFVAQRLKRTPPEVGRIHASRLISPNRDGRRDVGRLSFRLKRADTITVRVVDDADDTVRTLLSGRAVPALKRVHLRWNGRTDAGTVAADGRYHYRVNLQRQGRSVLLPDTTRLDLTAPHPRVRGIDPAAAAGPVILPLPSGGAATIHLASPRSRWPIDALIYRTAPDPALVTTLTAAPGVREVRWDGTADGRPVPAGTYVVALRTRDGAGNVGSTPRRLPPRAAYGQRLPGHAGITVRELAVQPPLTPTVSGEPATFGVDARQRPFTWTLRRVGEARPVARRKRPRTKPALHIDAPDGPSGLYLLRVRSGVHRTRVPFPVQATRRRHVLVVLPAILWDGIDPVDDDGDGWPNTLSGGLPVRRARVLADGVSGDLRRRVAPLLAYLDREHLRYDLTTDLALAAGTGPPLSGHRGVILAGDERWLTAGTLRALRDYVRGGGHLATFGVDALRRQVRLTPTQLLDPTAPAPTDALGATVRPLARPAGGVTLTNLVDQIDLFAGGTGRFGGYDRFEETASVGPGAQIVASAVTPDQRRGIVAERLGRGLVVRVGLPQLPERLGRPGNETALVSRIWSLLAR